MKHLIITTFVAISLAPLYLAAASHASSTDEVKAQLEKLASSKAHNGGIVTRPAKGRFAVVANPEQYDKINVPKALSTLSSQLKFQIESITNTATVTQSNAAKLMDNMNLNIAIFLISDINAPMSVVAMEERWAFINVQKLMDGNVDARVKDRRIRNELARVVKALFVGANTAIGGSAARTGADFDVMTTSPIDSATLIAMIRGLSSYGLMPSRTVPYRRACEEGWAPQPTNDVQQAIWNEVHQLPAKPIKIEFDPGKGK